MLKHLAKKKHDYFVVACNLPQGSFPNIGPLRFCERRALCNEKDKKGTGKKRQIGAPRAMRSGDLPVRLEWQRLKQLIKSART